MDFCRSRVLAEKLKVFLLLLLQHFYRDIQLEEVCVELQF